MHHRRKLTVIVPCYNERETILVLLDRLKQISIDMCVIVIDNCSTDGTRELLRWACHEETWNGYEAALRAGAAARGEQVLRGNGYIVLLRAANFTKAASIKMGLSLARSDYVICQDADLEYDPRDIVRLVNGEDDTGARAVFGSRLANQSLRSLSVYQVGRIALTTLFRFLYGSNITDVATCYKLMRTDVAQALMLRPSSGFDLDFEIPARLCLSRIAIDELPISYRPRDRAHGKKISWRDGLSAIWTMLKVQFEGKGFRNDL